GLKSLLSHYDTCSPSCCLGRLSDEIISGECALCRPGHSIISHSSNRDCPGGCSRDPYVAASAVCGSAALVVARATGNCRVHDPVVRFCPNWLHLKRGARSFDPRFFRRICLVLD